MKISVIIPTLNEESSLAATLRLLAGIENGVEVIVADGGSTDATVQIAEKSGAKVVRCERGRGRQLAAGARAATGEIMWFLHADTRPAPDALAAIREALAADRGLVGGNFTLVFDGDSRPARFMTWIYPHFRKLGLLYGDSAIFARRDAYDACGGFADLPLFEDVEFVGRLRRTGRLAHLEARVETSSRRFERRSFTLTFLRWVIFQGLYWIGVSPHFLARHYHVIR